MARKKTNPEIVETADIKQPETVEAKPEEKVKKDKKAVKSYKTVICN